MEKSSKFLFQKIALILFIFAANLSFGQTTTVTVNYNNVALTPGQSISVPVIFNSTANVGTWQVMIYYNKDVLTYNSTSFNPAWTGITPSANGSYPLPANSPQYPSQTCLKLGWITLGGSVACSNLTAFTLNFTYNGGTSNLEVINQNLGTLGYHSYIKNPTAINTSVVWVNGTTGGPLVPITSLAGGGLWDAGTTWDLGHKPNTSNSFTYIESNPATPVVIDANVTLASDIRINTGKALTVNSGKTLNINGKVLTVKSDASFVNNGTVTGNVKVERLVTGDMWHLISSPITAAQAKVFMHYYTGSYSSIYLRDYSAVSNNWTYIYDSLTTLTPAKGYGIWADITTFSQPNPLVKFDGTLNTTSSISYSNSGSGWNLIGNPFTSAINWNTVTGKGNLAGGAFYCWNSTAGKYSVSDGYNTVNQLPISSPYIIPAMQGFFVKANASGSLGIANSKVHSAQAYYKSTPATDRIRLSAERGSFKDEAIVVINESATNNYDVDYDASKLFANNTDLPEIYTLAGTEAIAINKVGTVPSVIPVNVKMGVADNVTITASDFNDFDANVYITLEDMLTGTFQNLRDKPTYTFAASVGENSGRFKLHFSFNALGVEENNNGNINVYSNSNTIYINSSEKINEINVYNMLGQLIISKAGNDNLNTINVQSADANYIVKVTTVNGVYTKKVFIK